MYGTTTTGAIGAIANTSSEAEEYRESIARLREKEQALRAQLEDAPRDHQLRYRLALVREMLRDTRGALRQLQPRRRSGGQPKSTSLDGQTWQWMEKQCWDQLESMDRDNRERREWMRAVLDDGTAEMTARQRQVFTLLYRDGKRAPDVAAELGVDPSTIYRTARRAVEKLRRYAEARELVRTCVRADGTVDVRRVVVETAFLTNRQKQVLILTLNGLNGRQIGERLGVDRSTAARTLRRGERRLKKLTHYLSGPELRAIRDEKIRRESLNWQKSCKELAWEYGVNLSVIYRLTAGTRRWSGMTALQYDIWKRRQAGESPRSIADALGMDVGNVYQALARAKKQQGVCDMINTNKFQRGGGAQTPSLASCTILLPIWAALRPVR